MTVKKYALLIGTVISCLGLLAACTPAPLHISLPSLTLPSLPMQPVHVIPAYEGVADYIQAVEADANADRGVLYLEHVVEPYAEACWGLDAAELPAEYPAAMVPFWDFERIKMTIDVLRASNVAEDIWQAMLRSSLALPGPETTICVFPVNSQRADFVRNRMHGVSGGTNAAGEILLQLYPVGDWLDWIPYVVAHEHYHSATMDRYGLLADPENITLLDLVVSEGKADTFAQILYPDVSAPWTQALSPEQEARIWQRMQADLDATDPALFTLYLYGDGGTIPNSAGYTIGYSIVQSYLEQHPDLSVEAWSATKAGELLQESGYGAETR